MALLRYLQAFILLAWPPALFAAQTLEDALGGITGWTWFFLFMISTLSGVTALLWRLSSMVSGAEKPVNSHLHLVVLAQMTSSWLAGLLSFLLGSRFGLQPLEVCAAIIVASFLGSKFIDIVGEKWLTRKFSLDKE